MSWAEIAESAGKASGASRELDGQVALAAGLPQAFFGEAFGTKYVDGPSCFDGEPIWAGGGRSYEAPDFTASVDAMMALINRIEPRAPVKTWSPHYVAAVRIGGEWGEAGGGTLPLALLSAFCLAMQSREAVD